MFYTPFVIHGENYKNTQVHQSKMHHFSEIDSFCANNSVTMLFEYTEEKYFLEKILKSCKKDQDFKSTINEICNENGFKAEKIGSAIYFFRSDSRYLPFSTVSQVITCIDTIKSTVSDIPLSKYEIKDGKLYSLDNEKLWSLFLRIDKLKYTEQTKESNERNKDSGISQKLITKSINIQDIPENIILEINEESKKQYFNKAKSMLMQYEKILHNISNEKYIITLNKESITLSPVEKALWSLKISKSPLLLSVSKKIEENLNNGSHINSANIPNKKEAYIFTIGDMARNLEKKNDSLRIDLAYGDIPFYVFGVEQADIGSILRSMARISKMDYTTRSQSSISITKKSIAAESDIKFSKTPPSLMQKYIYESIPFSYFNYIEYNKMDFNSPVQLRNHITRQIVSLREKYFSLLLNHLENEKMESLLYEKASPEIKNLISNFVILEVVNILLWYIEDCPDVIEDVRNGEVTLIMRPDGGGQIHLKSLKSGRSVYYSAYKPRP